MIRATITGMLAAFRSAREGEDDAEPIVNLYASDLADEPLWAVAKACEAFRKGKVEGASLDFPPSVPRLLQEVQMQVARRKYELHLITKILAAEITPDFPAADPEKMVEMAEGCQREIAAAAAARTIKDNERERKYRAEREAALADIESRKARNSMRADGNGA